MLSTISSSSSSSSLVFCSDLPLGCVFSVLAVAAVDNPSFRSGVAAVSGALRVEPADRLDLDMLALDPTERSSPSTSKLAFLVADNTSSSWSFCWALRLVCLLEGFMVVESRESPRSSLSPPLFRLPFLGRFAYADCFVDNSSPRPSVGLPAITASKLDSSAESSSEDFVRLLLLVGLFEALAPTLGATVNSSGAPTFFLPERPRENMVSVSEEISLAAFLVSRVTASVSDAPPALLVLFRDILTGAPCCLSAAVRSACIESNAPAALPLFRVSLPGPIDADTGACSSSGIGSRTEPTPSESSPCLPTTTPSPPASGDDPSTTTTPSFDKLSPPGSTSFPSAVSFSSTFSISVPKPNSLFDRLSAVWVTSCPSAVSLSSVSISAPKASCS